MDVRQREAIQGEKFARKVPKYLKMRR
jgi:hypothetical protein